MTIPQLITLATSFPATAPMPALFVGHGSPMNAVEQSGFTENFRALAADIPTPAAILCISAHWTTHGTRATSMAHPPTIHDFYGFPDALYAVRYPAPGSPALASAAAQALAPTPVGMDSDWGLDHGTWSVLCHMYPEAAVPVVQLSLDIARGPEYHYALGQQLAVLRSHGVLVVGSGNIVHNLGLLDFGYMGSHYGYPWATEAADTVRTHLLSGDFAPLVDYPSLGPSMALAVPTPEHYLPLLYILGLRDPAEPLALSSDVLVGGSISMTCVRVG
jgi:4,5-DOPA dioxygenase extradiol